MGYKVLPRVEEITIVVPHKIADALRYYKTRYNTSVSGIVNIVLAYYFGDGADHLRCESCDCYDGKSCLMEYPAGYQMDIFENVEHGTLLDKGTVVVGLPIDEQGF